MSMNRRYSDIAKKKKQKINLHSIELKTRTIKFCNDFIIISGKSIKSTIENKL